MDRPVGVVGGGTMGLGVAQSLATAGHPVVVLDPADQVRATGSDRCGTACGWRSCSGGSAATMPRCCPRCGGRPWKRTWTTSSSWWSAGRSASR
ncbi:3-hydroxyacyl-CoA dehydrogenase NAD-binding domain-containing protein [Kutzneria kofuensis]|uniref:3-hydroxyacyl-CoA dehydrogenase NAD-binding domain-containing protein n=1 Tax=Kutzneria kofuensis TaxID=103725 RepID=UPI0031E9A0E9